MVLVDAQLFGRPSVTILDRPYHLQENQRSHELFAYVLLHGGKPQHREKLSDRLWGEINEGRSKQYLRKALWQLNNCFRDCEEPPALLAADGQWIQLSPSLELTLDIRELECALTETQNVPGAMLSDDQAAHLQRAVSHCKGDLLEGWYAEWCLYERERLQQLYLNGIDKLMGYCEVHGFYELGIAYGHIILQHDYLREHAHRQMMRLRYQSGDRVGALHQYEQCAAALASELSIEPSERTRRLYEQILLDQGPAVQIEPLPPSHDQRQYASPLAAGASSLPALVQEARQLAAQLNAVCDSIAAELNR